MEFADVAARELVFLTQDCGFRITGAAPEAVMFESEGTLIEATLESRGHEQHDQTWWKKLVGAAAKTLQRNASAWDGTARSSLDSYSHGGLRLVIRIRPKMHPRDSPQL